MNKTLVCFCLALTVAFSSTMAQQPHYAIKKIFSIKSNGGWDYLVVHNGLLFVSHGSQVNIVDKTTGDSLGVIPNTKGVHGIEFIPALNKGYTSNGQLNNITVFNASSFAVETQISVGQNPDAILYDSFTNRIITCNGKSNDLSFVDPFTNQLVATIAVGGKPETAVTDGAGKLYVNIEDKNEIVAIDLKQMKVLNHYSLGKGEAPTGLVYDAVHNRLFAGCEQLLVVLNAANGKIVTSLPIGDGCDGVAFDAASKTIFTSNGEGTMTVIKQVKADRYTITETVKTKPGARTIALDPKTHYLYLPTAEFMPLAANAPRGQRPSVIPGSFKVLVMAAAGNHISRQ